jgi:predicted ATP-grasp superfamily ATP-dependent carboligase
VGVLHDACNQAGIPAASLWAAVPHYVQLTPSPRAAEALCVRLADIVGAKLDVSELEEAGRSYAEQVTEAVSADAETQAYVEELEQRVDQLEQELNLPSGDSIAAELTRFLRERESGDGPGSEH